MTGITQKNIVISVKFQHTVSPILQGLAQATSLTLNISRIKTRPLPQELNLWQYTYKENIFREDRNIDNARSILHTSVSLTMNVAWLVKLISV